MRSLQNMPRVVPPDSDFPYARIKDNAPGIPGTPVGEVTNGDQHQFFEKLADAAGVVANELPDNAYSGFQYFEALMKFGFNFFSKDIFLSMIRDYAEDDLIIMQGFEPNKNGR
jgi:hypothetical protein